MHLFQNLNKKQKALFFTILSILLIIVIYSIATIISHIGKVKTSVQFAPYYATVTINDKEVKNPSTIYLTPGVYQVTVEAEHFNTYNTTIDINQDIHYIVGVLTASDSIGEQYINDHQNDFINTEGLIGTALNEEGAARKKQYPILKYLPINNSLYSISYTYDSDSSTPIISVKADPIYLDTAVAKLKSLDDVDLTSYQIIFNNNPFNTFQDSPSINPVECIKNSFKLNNYILSDGQFINDNYYLTQAYINDYDLNYSYAHYLILLQKKDNFWHIINLPQPILTINNTPNIDKSILETANNI